MNKPTHPSDCPCGSGDLFSTCCSPYINGLKPAPTAETLMRSRYCAYVLNLYDYIYTSWHPGTRPDRETLKPEPGIRWIRLKIIDATKDTVEFRATYKQQGKAYHLHERSRFQLEQGLWYYVDGQMEPGKTT